MFRSENLRNARSSTPDTPRKNCDGEIVTKRRADPLRIGSSDMPTLPLDLRLHLPKDAERLPSKSDIDEIGL
jgi:hypothetical protein